MKLKNLFRKLLRKLFPPTKYYFIASVREETVYRPSGEPYTTHDSRTWGFYKSKKRAIQAITENWTDMNESGYYPWMVLGTYEEGLLAQRFDIPELWFKEHYTKLSFDELKELWDKCPEDKKENCTINEKTGRVTWFDPDKNCWRSNFNGYAPCDPPSWTDHIAGWCL